MKSMLFCISILSTIGNFLPSSWADSGDAGAAFYGEYSKAYREYSKQAESKSGPALEASRKELFEPVKKAGHKARVQANINIIETLSKETKVAESPPTREISSTPKESAPDAVAGGAQTITFGKGK